MSPVLDKVYVYVQAFSENNLSAEICWSVMSSRNKQFMLWADPRSRLWRCSPNRLAGMDGLEQVSRHPVARLVISELKTAFQIGFTIFTLRDCRSGGTASHGNGHDEVPPAKFHLAAIQADAVRAGGRLAVADRRTGAVFTLESRSSCNEILDQYDPRIRHEYGAKPAKMAFDAGCTHAGGGIW
jgi:hypothetical protein